MQGHIGLLADDPAVMRDLRNVKQRALLQLGHRTVFERNRCRPGHHHSDVFDLAVAGSQAAPHMLGPLPSWLVGGAPENEASQANDLELSRVEDAYLKAPAGTPRLLGARPQPPRYNPDDRRP